MLTVPKSQPLFHHICIFAKKYCTPIDDNYIALPSIEKDNEYIMFPTHSKYQNVTFILNTNSDNYSEHEQYMEWNISNITDENLKFIKDKYKEYCNENNYDEINIYTFEIYDWVYYANKPKRSINSIYLASDIDIFYDFNKFINNEHIYKKSYIPYTRTYLLNGPPGCGKTSLIHSLASEYNYNICILDILDKSLQERILRKAFQRAPNKSFIVIEDIDQYFNSDDNSQLSFSTIINILDGLLSINNSCVFITTNDKSKINDIFLRRIDKIYNFGYPSYKEIMKLNLDENTAKHFAKYKTTINIVQKFLFLNKDIHDFKEFNEQYFNDNTTYYT